MNIMNTYYRFIDILKSYHILKKIIIVEILLVLAQIPLQCRLKSVKILTMMNMHGNVMQLLNINQSKVHVHDAHSLRSTVLNNIMQELLQTNI